MSTMISSGANLPASADATPSDAWAEGIAVRLANHDWLFLSADTAAPRATLHAPVQ